MTLRSPFRTCISILFYALFLVVPLLFTSVNDELFEFNKMLAVYAIVILMAWSWIGACIFEKKILFQRTPLDIPMALFVGSQIISTLFSIDIHTSIFGYYTRFNGGLLSVFSYVFLYYAFVTFTSRKQIGSYISALLAGGVLSALYATPEHFGASPSCLLFTGKFDVACWVQDVKSRVFGTFGQPNWLAAYLGMLLPLAIVNTKTVTYEIKLLEDETTKNAFAFLFRILVVSLFCAVLFFTGSRSGMGGVAGGLFLLGAAGGAFYYVSHKKNLGTPYYETILKYMQTLGIAAVVFIVSIFIFPNPILDKLQSYLPHQKSVVIPMKTAPQPQPVAGTQLEVGGSESGEIRSVVWQGALRVWQRYPIFGSGVETFAYSYYRDRLKAHNLLSEWDFLYNKAHNEFLNYLATTGLVGLLTYLILLGGMIVIPIRYAFQLFFVPRSNKHEPIEHVIHDAFLLIALTSGIIIVSISNFFGFSTVMVSVLLFIFAAIVIVMHPTSPKTIREATLEPIQFSGDTTSYVVIAVLACFFCLPLFGIYRIWTADVAYAKGKQLNNAGQYENAYPYLRSAIERVDDEPTYHDEYSSNLASLAVLFAQQKNATQASDFATMALQESDTTIAQNSVHTNFWKTRIRVYLTLASLDRHFYNKAVEALQTAHNLSPTDPKLVYYLGLIAQEENNIPVAKQYLMQAIDLKTNYEEARTALAKLYEAQNEPAKALEQYQYMVQFINPNNTIAQAKIASLSAQKKK